MTRAVGGEELIQQLENIERIRARGDPAFQGIDQTLGGGPGVEVAVESGADRSDFGFCPRLLGTDDGESGIAAGQLAGRATVPYQTENRAFCIDQPP